MYVFNKSKGCVLIPSVVSNNNVGTIYARVKFTTNTSDQQACVFATNSSVTNNYAVFGTLNTKCFFQTNIGGSVGRWNGDTVLAINTWYDLVITFNDTDYVMYVNKNVESLTNSGSSAKRWFDDVSGLDQFVLGCYSSAATGTWFLGGEMSQVAIWDVVLTATEVNSLTDSKSKHQPLFLQRASLKYFAALDEFPNGETSVRKDGFAHEDSANCVVVYHMDVDEDPLTDDSGNNNDASLFAAGKPNFITTVFTGAGGYDFNGTDAFASATTPGLTGNWSVFAWVKIDTAVTQFAGIAEWTDASDNRRGLSLDASGDILGIYNDGSRHFRTGTGVFANVDDGDQHLLTATWDGSNLKFYVDGISVVPSADLGTGAHDTTSVFWIGKMAVTSTALPLDGIIDEVALYNTARTAAQIRAVYLASRKTFDLSGNGNDGLPAPSIQGKAEDSLVYSPSIILLAEGIILFELTGTAISPVISIGGDQVDWNAFSNTITTPSDSSATVEIRTTDGGASPSWSSYGAVGSASNSVFAQIKLTLNASTGAETGPTVDIIKLRALMASALLPFHFEGIKTMKITASATAPLVPEKELIVECNTDNGGAMTLSMLPALDVGGKVYNVKNTGTSNNDVTVDANGSETIDGETTQLVPDNSNMKIQSNGINWVVL